MNVYGRIDALAVQLLREDDLSFGDATREVGAGWVMSPAGMLSAGIVTVEVRVPPGCLRRTLGLSPLVHLIVPT